MRIVWWEKLVTASFMRSGETESLAKDEDVIKRNISSASY